MTCGHVVDFSDTLITRYVGSDYRITPFIRSISIKTNQLIFLNEVGGGIALDVLALDRSADLAILGQKIDPRQSIALPVFSYPLGKSKDLEWGSFVYVFGYPAGYRMVTKGIVSLSAKPQGSFVVDAVVSPGSSGSIALAIRDGVPNFELVGMIKMIPAQTTYVLTPSKDGDVEYDPIEPYHGEVFVQRKAEIQQGIAVAIPTETIVAFIEKNRFRLSQQGYDLTSWIKPAKKETTAK
jgi:S1-C subfamily serine protease